MMTRTKNSTSKVRGPGNFGRGFYFSADARYSSEGFAKRHAGDGAVLLCRVLVGKSCTVPNMAGPHRRVDYDSHRSDAEYRETVVFEPDQVLPVYCVAFR